MVCVGSRREAVNKRGTKVNNLVSTRQCSGAAGAADEEDAASAMGAARAWRRGAPKALEAGAER